MMTEKHEGREKNTTITIIRVLSTLMIVGCHLASWIGANAIAMLLNVGVYVFLLISGSLYSNKTIQNGCSFMRNRWVRLCVPMYLLVAFLSAVQLVNMKQVSIGAVFAYLLNIQGIGFMISRLTIPVIDGLGPLWFLTTIMLCYGMLIVTKKTSIDRCLQKRPFIVLGLLAAASILFTCTIQVHLYYFLAFFIGYAMAKKNQKLTAQEYVLATVFMLCAVATRLVSRHYADATILYDNIIVPFTHIVLAVWICLSMFYFNQLMPEKITRIANCRPVVTLERLSMYLYMTHDLFLDGPFCVDLLPLPTILQVLIFVVAALVSAAVLEMVSKPVIRVLSCQK